MRLAMIPIGATLMVLMLLILEGATISRAFEAPSVLLAKEIAKSVNQRAKGPEMGVVATRWDYTPVAQAIPHRGPLPTGDLVPIKLVEQGRAYLPLSSNCAIVERMRNSMTTSSNRAEPPILHLPICGFPAPSGVAVVPTSRSTATSWFAAGTVCLALVTIFLVNLIELYSFRAKKRE
ncbi:hypothetical protein NLM27_27050 [Bradyrhizobium sp. CCGB12]|uniref:hypothetical protein n=1 Tax=Bradyrhizobium sp. CCGB12 TaxID=2949632 RepID=UPI0020B343DB|nr:hypothetical protein [Bradyrhizobium sp. CCGB12]MCP3392408.1 hypothetical protein [Bradyrhizobium sp. CCGB12]